MKTAVDPVYVGKARQFNRRFAQLCSHYLVEPMACTPGAGWEKGQVENQVGTIRERWFTPRLRFASDVELNAWLLEQCVASARRQAHPDDPERTVFAVFEAERPALIPYRGPFDGRRIQIPRRASRGSITTATASWPGRSDDPWHYVPVLNRKSGALRNGAPFKGWVLPGSLGRVQRTLARVDDGDRQVVTIASADVILNVLARPGSPIASATTPCARDRMQRHELMALRGQLKLARMRAHFDDVVTTGRKRQPSFEVILGDLLRAEITDTQARSIRYQLGIATLPLAKKLTDFVFVDSPVNQALIDDVATGAVLS